MDEKNCELMIFLLSYVIYHPSVTKTTHLRLFIFHVG
jgi:hypothetical protein